MCPCFFLKAQNNKQKSKDLVCPEQNRYRNFSTKAATQVLQTSIQNSLLLFPYKYQTIIVMKLLVNHRAVTEDCNLATVRMMMMVDEDDGDKEEGWLGTGMAQTHIQALAFRNAALNIYIFCK